MPEGVIALVYRAPAEIPHTLRINNRSVLNGLLESLGAKDHAVTILRAIDKLDKLGEDAVELSFRKAQLSLPVRDRRRRLPKAVRGTPHQWRNSF